MTALTKAELIKELNSGKLVVTPMIDPLAQIGRVSIDLRMGNTAAMVRGAGLSHVDPAKYAKDRDSGDFSREQHRRRKLEKLSVPFGEPIVLHAGTLILVPTFEWVQLPPHLMGVVTARSCWAREGLSIATAVFIDPCYNGIITLELANLGQVPIKIYPGMRIAQIALYRAENPQKKCDPHCQSQFYGSFEPDSGDIVKHDIDFLPRSKKMPVG
ncbi:dCTP deaminase [Solimonas sp. SE-A11]|uniref:dCTP deaminase n=1 Tax=Solimonas sp. SE-A11 TaxID=3054954 RepID=UPI00259CE64E|nr:dCTP deaminase [Solimonas sp. SE-A11]MDM4772870.1 dCTP deaminase [Solimonas sp. SE-A11]